MFSVSFDDGRFNPDLPSVPRALTQAHATLFSRFAAVRCRSNPLNIKTSCSQTTYRNLDFERRT